MTDFYEDYKYSLEKSEELNQLYLRKYKDILKIETVTDPIQQNKGIDKILQLINAQKIETQEKVRRKRYNDIALELYHLFLESGVRKPGWLYTCEAPLLMYNIPDGNGFENYPFNLPRLRQSIIDNYDYLIKKYPLKASCVNEFKDGSHYVTYNLCIPPQDLYDLMKKKKH